MWLKVSRLGAESIPKVIAYTVVSWGHLINYSECRHYKNQRMNFRDQLEKLEIPVMNRRTLLFPEANFALAIRSAVLFPERRLANLPNWGLWGDKGGISHRFNPRTSIFTLPGLITLLYILLPSLLLQFSLEYLQIIIIITIISCLNDAVVFFFFFFLSFYCNVLIISFMKSFLQCSLTPMNIKILCLNVRSKSVMPFYLQHSQVSKMTSVQILNTFVLNMNRKQLKL